MAAFLRICLRTLRAGDVVGHEGGTDVLLPQARVEPEDIPRTARAVLSELVRRFTDATGIALECGWTVVEADYALEPTLRAATATALTRGRQEREHFDFFATLGHEMRTPLMSISGYVQTLIERDLDRNTARRFLETAQLQTSRLRRLVDNQKQLKPSGCCVRLTLSGLSEAVFGGCVGACCVDGSDVDVVFAAVVPEPGDCARTLMSGDLSPSSSRMMVYPIELRVGIKRSIAMVIVSKVLDPTANLP